MADCECLERCIFFNDKMATRPATAGVYKRRFCHEENTHCARYIVFKNLGKEAVPNDLYPNEFQRAEKLLENKTILH